MEYVDPTKIQLADGTRLISLFMPPTDGGFPDTEAGQDAANNLRDLYRENPELILACQKVTRDKALGLLGFELDEGFDMAA